MKHLQISAISLLLIALPFAAHAKEGMPLGGVEGESLAAPCVNPSAPCNSPEEKLKEKLPVKAAVHNRPESDKEVRQKELAVDKHNWSTSEREKKKKARAKDGNGSGKVAVKDLTLAAGTQQGLEDFAKDKDMEDKPYSDVCSAYVDSNPAEGVPEKARTHWQKKSPRQFKKPKYTKTAGHLFGRTVKQHVCFTTRKHVRDGGAEENIKLESMKK